MSIYNEEQVVVFGDDVRKAMLVGISKLAKAVGATMGPRGRNVVIRRGTGDTSKPHLTKDGVTVARAINPTDPIENMAVTFVKEASKRACTEAGDGTTTATVLSYEIAKRAINSLDDKSNAIALQRGIEAASSAIQEKLEMLALPCKDLDKLKHVATISANSDSTIGNICAQAIFEAGDNGVVLVESTQMFDDAVEVTSGMAVDKGYYSEGFINDRSAQTQVLQNVKVVIVDGPLESFDPFVEMLRCGDNKDTFLFVAEEFSADVIATATKARPPLAKCDQKRANLAIMEAAEFGLRRKEWMRDLAAYTNAAITGEHGDIPVSEFKYEHCGKAERVVLNRKSSLVESTAGTEEAINERVGIIRRQLEKSTAPFERGKLERRIGVLSGKLIKIKVGGLDQYTVAERKDRFDDAVCAANAAFKYGILPGGGSALLAAAFKVSEALDMEIFNDKHPDFKNGWQIVMGAIEAPMVQIATNAGKNVGAIVAKVDRALLDNINNDEYPSAGYDADKDEICNMIEAGIIDPSLVTRSAIKYAAQIAGNIVTTEVGILG